MEWKWSKNNEKSVANFVTDKSAELLKLAVNPFDLLHNCEGRRRLVEVIYQALVNKEINYTCAKYNPDDAIQRIRNPHEVLSFPGTGTCLDLALLFCGICLGYDLLPLLIIIEGHAFAAVSLNHKRDEWNGYGRERQLFNKQELFQGEQNLQKLRKLIDDDGYIAIECTGFARTQSFRGSQPEEVGRTESGFLTFERAIEAGREQLENQERNFKFAIDIAVAHYSWKVEPSSIRLPYGLGNNLSPKEQGERRRLLNKVKNSWIKNVLKISLHLQPIITLELEERPTAVAHPASGAEEFAAESGQILPSGTDIADLFYDMGDGRNLLILGDKGAGKTISLLKITEKLIARAEEDLSQLIPVVFNLSSWITERSDIDEWLVQELKSSYQTDKTLAEKWIKDKQLLLLLDGLDEVKNEYRLDCISALNKFIQDYGGTEMIICCRLEDYPLSQLLQLQQAIYIKHLTTEQVYQYLEQAGKELEAVNTIVQQDSALLQLVKSPLMLNIMSRAYEGLSVAELPRQGSIEKRRQDLFNAYIKRMFERRRTSHQYSEKNAKKWLIWLAQMLNKESQSIFLSEKNNPSSLPNARKISEPYSDEQTKNGLRWLAQRMMQESQTVFLIERIQPSWLPNLLTKFIYYLEVAVIYGLAFGLCLGLGAAWSYGLIIGLAVGGIFGFAFGLSAWLTVVGGIDWIVSVSVNAIVNVIDRLMDRESIKNNPDIVTTTIPNQEIKETIRSAFSWGLFSAFVSGIISQILQPQFFLIGVLFGFVYGATTQGRFAIQHLSLRIVLFLSHKIPWNYADFLNYATERIFLQKVGGGYIFIHRLLQEHFAQMRPDE
jgi:NACHT domain